MRTRVVWALGLAAILGCGDAADGAVQTARAELGNGVDRAELFRVNGQDWIAAATGGRVMLLRRTSSGWEPRDPDLPNARSWGITDVDGDAQPELWVAAADGAASLDLRAYSVRSGLTYRVIVPVSGGRPDEARREFSYNVMERRDIQDRLTTLARSLARTQTP